MHEVTDEESIAIKIASKGYYNGDPENVLKARCDLVLKTLSYIRFVSDFEDAFWALNRE